MLLYEGFRQKAVSASVHTARSAHPNPGPPGMGREFGPDKYWSCDTRLEVSSNPFPFPIVTTVTKSFNLDSNFLLKTGWKQTSSFQLMVKFKM